MSSTNLPPAQNRKLRAPTKAPILSKKQREAQELRVYEFFDKKIRTLRKEVAKINPAIKDLILRANTADLPLPKTLNTFEYWMPGIVTGEVPKDVLELIEFLDNEKRFQFGFCYTHSSRLMQHLENYRELRPRPYFGWLFSIYKDGSFTYDAHQWVVINQRTLIDLTVDPFFYDDFDPRTSKNEIANMVVERMNHVPVNQRIVLGNVPKNLLYLGCQCSPDTGAMIYRWWFSQQASKNKTPMLVSEGPSELQLTIDDLLKKQNPQTEVENKNEQEPPISSGSAN